MNNARTQQERSDEHSQSADEDSGVREEEAKQMRKTASGLRCLGYELRDDVGADEMADRVMEMADEMERGAAKVAGQHAFRVVLEFEPVYASNDEEAVEECLHGAVFPETEEVDKLDFQD